MATNLVRAKMILGGMLNRTVAEITDAQVNRAARALAHRADPVMGLQTYDALPDADKVAFYVTRMLNIQVAAVKEMDAASAAATATATARAAVDSEFTPG